MTLTAEQQTRLLALIDQKWPSPRECPLCKQTEWVISPRVKGLGEFSVSGTAAQAPAVPLVVMTCPNCGYTVLLNAIVLGLVAPPAGEVAGG